MGFISPSLSRSHTSQRYKCCPRDTWSSCPTPASITGPHLMLWAGASWATQGCLDTGPQFCLLQEALLAQKSTSPPGL